MHAKVTFPAVLAAFAAALLVSPAHADQPPSAFQLVLDGNAPAFEIGPNQCRMATCYRDKAGTYHLFTDFMEKATHSFGAEVRYYRSGDLRAWEFVETAVQKGEGEAPDAYGAASPHVLATDERIYLFYAGRGNPVGGRANVYAPRGKAGYVAGRILVANAKADEHGAPVEGFKKHGVIVEPGDGWDAMRLDDPCAVLDEDTVHLFFKGFDNNRQRDRVHDPDPEAAKEYANMKPIFEKCYHALVGVYEDLARLQAFTRERDECLRG